MLMGFSTVNHPFWSSPFMENPIYIHTIQGWFQFTQLSKLSISAYNSQSYHSYYILKWKYYIYLQLVYHRTTVATHLLFIVFDSCHISPSYGMCTPVIFGKKTQHCHSWIPVSRKNHPRLSLIFCPWINIFIFIIIEGSLEVKLPTIWTDEKQSRAEAERRGRLEERRSEEKE